MNDSGNDTAGPNPMDYNDQEMIVMLTILGIYPIISPKPRPKPYLW